MCSDTERLKMFIILHIFFFFVLYDSSGMSFDDVNTIVSCNLSRAMYCDLYLGKILIKLN